MPKHTLRVTQVCRVTRIIEIEVEATSLHAAITLTQEEDSPAFDDKRWVEHHDLVDEEITSMAPDAEQLARQIVQAVMADEHFLADQLRPRLRIANRARRAAGLSGIRPTQAWYFDNERARRPS